MRIALDATYSEDPHPTGIAIYSRELLRLLPQLAPADQFIACYRLKQWRLASRRHDSTLPVRLLLPPVPTFRAELFHALNQRVDKRPARAVVTTFHDLFVMTGEYSTPEFRARFTRQAREAADKSDLIIAVSAFTAGQVSDLLAVERSRIRVIPHGVHPVKEQSTVQRQKIVLFVGSLQVRKNVSRLVKAFERMPSDWRLLLAGASGGYGAARILEDIAASPAASRITMTGYVSGEELERLYAVASIFAFPSLDEGFGIPVLEAMARGLPVVTSNRSALPEVSGGAAVLVDPESPEEIGDALYKLAIDEDVRETLSARGRAHARHYTWERTAAETYKTYKEAAGAA